MPGSSMTGGALDVWSIALDQPAARLAALAATLAPAERARAARFHFARDRDRFVAGRGAVRAILAGYTGLAPAALRVGAGPHGKPALEGARCEFNLSRSGARAVLAVTAAGPLGVDLERLRPVPDAAAIAETHFAPAERAALAALPARDRDLGFLLAWTRKEAVIKATGEGLSRPLDSFEVTLAPGAPARLLRLDGDDPARWELHDLDAAPGFVGAVVAAPGLHVVWRRWDS